MILRVPFIAVLTLAGCSQSEGEKAEAEYEIARSVGVDSAAACQFESRIRDAYLSDQNEDKYKHWLRAANLSCIDADLDWLENGGPL